MSQRLMTMPSVLTDIAPVVCGFIDSRGPVVSAAGKPQAAKVVQGPPLAFPSVLSLAAVSRALGVPRGLGVGRARPEVCAPPPASVAGPAGGEAETTDSDWPGAQVSASSGQRPPVASCSPERVARATESTVASTAPTAISAISLPLPRRGLCSVGPRLLVRSGAAGMAVTSWCGR